MSELVINNNIVNDLLIKQFTNYVFMMIVTDIKGNIIYANKKYCQFNHINFESIKNKRYNLFYLVDENQDVFSNISDNKEVIRLEAKHPNKNKQEVWEDINIVPIFDENNLISHYAFLSLDITDKVKLRNDLLNKSYIDSLTGMANRLSIIEKIEQERLNIATPSSFCLGIIDCDKFKTINDQYGHAIGDHVLCEIAQRLLALERQQVYCGRLGGDEFAVLFPAGLRSCSLLLLEIIESLWRGMEKPIKINKEKIIVPSISLGIAEYPKDGKTLSELLKSADKQLYAIKEKGGNKYGFYSEY